MVAFATDSGRSMTISSLIGALALTFVMVGGGPTAGRAEVAVDLELVLAVDVSGSVDPEEALLQRDGYVQAFLDPQVVAAIRSGFLGRIAVVYFEWAGFGYDRIVVDWTPIGGGDDARAFSAALAGQPIVTARRTSISEALQVRPALVRPQRLPIAAPGHRHLGRRGQ